MISSSIQRPIFVALILILGVSFPLQAQQGWEIGGWAGTSFYFGDLNTNYSLNKPGLAAGAIARYNFNNRLCLRFGANYGNISGDDALSENSFERARNLDFKSVILDGIAQFEFNFLPYIHGSKDDWFTPYLFAGAGAYYFNPKTELNGVWYALRPMGTEGQFKGEEYYTVQGAMVYGGGFKFALDHVWSLEIEISSRHLFNDYLDDVSTVYPDMGDLESLRGDIAVLLSDRSAELIDTTPIGEAGRQRGDSTTRDTYTFVSVGLTYYFGSLKCPPFTR